MSLKQPLLLSLGLILTLPIIFGVPQVGAQPAAPVESVEQAAKALEGDTGTSASGSTMDLDVEAVELRDPFKRPLVVNMTPGTPVGALESFSVDEFKMVGSIVGTDRVRAILIDPKGQTHIVSERMKIGLKQGVIREIRASYVKVREKVINAIGREELIETDIKLISKNQSGQSAGGGY